MNGACDVQGGMRNVYKILVVQSRGKRPQDLGIDGSRSILVNMVVNIQDP